MKRLKKILKSVLITLNRGLIVVFGLFALSLYVSLEPPASALLVFPKMIATSIPHLFLLWGTVDLSVNIISIAIRLKRKKSVFIKVKHHVITRTSFSLVSSAILVFLILLYLVLLFRSPIEITMDGRIDVEMYKPFQHFRKMKFEMESVDIREIQFPRSSIKNGENSPAGYYYSSPYSEKEPKACILYIASGNWRSNDDSAEQALYKDLLSRGFDILSFLPRSRTDTNLQGILKDIEAAGQWLIDNKDRLGLDRIFLSGGSAGGHLALLAGSPGSYGNSLDIDGIIAFYPPADFVWYCEYFKDSFKDQNILDGWGNSLYALMDGQTMDELQTDTELSLIGERYVNISDSFLKASPVSYIHRENPPVLIIHGRKDEMCPYPAGRNYFESAAASGAHCVLLTLPLTNHAFDKVFGEVTPARLIAVDVIAWFAAGEFH